MNLSQKIAKRFRTMHFGNNRVGVSFKDQLTNDLNWQQATTKIGDFNTLADLVFHTNYYVEAVLKVLKGGPLDAHDKFSFDTPTIESPADWEKLRTKFWSEAEEFAALVEAMPEEKLWQAMANPKYGDWNINLQGLIEHTYYHLGQITLIKKMVVKNR